MTRYGGDYTLNQGECPANCSMQMLVATRIALEYARKVPTVAQLRERFGMSRATAYRWIAAFKAAKGEP